jgi:hypothetical protein
MDLFDRSAIPSLHAAARRHRSVYVSCLFTKAVSRLQALFAFQPRQTAPCA